MMPGFDGTGPRGTGPMTGGGRGYCVLPVKTGKDIPYAGTPRDTREGAFPGQPRYWPCVPPGLGFWRGRGRGWR